MDQFLGRETFLSLCRVASDGSKSVAEYLILFLTDLMQLSTATEAADSVCSRLLWTNEWTWLSWSSKGGPRKKVLITFRQKGGSTQGTATEHTPAEQNSWGRGFGSCWVPGFFLLFSILSVLCPWHRSLTKVQHCWFSYKNMLILAAWGEVSFISSDRGKNIATKRTQLR